MSLDKNQNRRGERASLGALLCCAVALYLVMNYAMVAYIASEFTGRGVHKSLAYFAWLGAGAAAFVMLVAFARTIAFTLCAVAVAVSLLVNYTYVIISGNVLTTMPGWFIELMVNEIDVLPSAITEFNKETLGGIVATVVVLSLFVLVRVRLRRNERAVALRQRLPWLASASVLAFVGFQVLATALQPPQSMAEANVFVAGVPALLATAPEGRPVAVQPVRPPLASKIVLLVDESVAYSAYKEIVGPALKSLPGIDFGMASSTGNCSATSNAMLRWGLERDRLRDLDYDPQTNPKIWAYAKAAGFHTVLIDGQQSKMSRQNFITRQELAHIDEYITAQSGYETDHRIAAALNERLRRPGREFIYVVKRGSHFPYELDYPPGTTPDDAPMLVKYAAAIAYATRDFFPPLMRDLDLSGALVIYTSDHGQDHSRRAHHCNPQPGPAEFAVPLAAFTRVPELTRLIAADASEMRDRASHANIFPTLLTGFGYDRGWAERIYGPTLAGPPAPYPRLPMALTWPQKQGTSLSKLLWITPDPPQHAPAH